MGIGALTNKKRIKTVLGIDASTNSIAFCLFDSTGPVKWGEINFVGNTVFERLADGQEKLRAVRDSLNADLYIIEGAVYIQNKRTVILLAESIGMIMSVLLANGGEAAEVSPIFWQNFIGNKALTKAEKDLIKNAFPDHKASWYSNKFRKLRKQRTADWVEKRYGIKSKNDNVSDAIAISSVGFDKFALD